MGDLQVALDRMVLNECLAVPDLFDLSSLYVPFGGCAKDDFSSIHLQEVYSLSHR